MVLLALIVHHFDVIGVEWDESASDGDECWMNANGSIRHTRCANEKKSEKISVSKTATDKNEWPKRVFHSYSFFLINFCNYCILLSCFIFSIPIVRRAPPATHNFSVCRPP